MAWTAGRAAYALGSKADEARVVDALGRSFPAVVERPAAATGVYLDTFDGGLRKAGLTLIESAAAGRREWILQTAGGETLGSIPPVPSAVGGSAPEEHGLAARAADFPPGPFRDRVAPALGLRRLAQVARFRLRRRSIRILDERGKTVARASIERAQAGAPGDAAPRRRVRPVLVLEPLRGYAAAARRVDRFLRERCGLEPAEPERFRRILAAAGRPVPGEGGVAADAAPRAPERGLRADEALRRILRAQLDVIEANARGTRDDLDSEFLHDFRVAVRRTRSALSQLRGVLPDDDVRRFRKRFKRLGAETGPLRDLDVYLLKMPGYRAALDAGAAEALDPLEALLHRRRREAHAALARVLDSDRYRKLVRAWRGYLDAEPAGRPRRARARSSASRRSASAARRRGCSSAARRSATTPRARSCTRCASTARSCATCWSSSPRCSTPTRSARRSRR